MRAQPCAATSRSRPTRSRTRRGAATARRSTAHQRRRERARSPLHAAAPTARCPGRRRARASRAAGSRELANRRARRLAAPPERRRRRLAVERAEARASDQVRERRASCGRRLRTRPAASPAAGSARWSERARGHHCPQRASPRRVDERPQLQDEDAVGGAAIAADLAQRPRRRRAMCSNADQRARERRSSRPAPAGARRRSARSPVGAGWQRRRRRLRASAVEQAAAFAQHDVEARRAPPARRAGRGRGRSRAVAGCTSVGDTGAPSSETPSPPRTSMISRAAPSWCVARASLARLGERCGRPLPCRPEC